MYCVHLPRPKKQYRKDTKRFSISLHWKLILQFPNRCFRVIFPHTDFLVVDRGHLKEFCDIPENTLSFVKAVDDIFVMRYIFNWDIATDFYHAAVGRAQLSRHLLQLMPAIVDELEAAFNDELMTVGDGTSCV